jgi:hypothetical protein
LAKRTLIWCALWLCLGTGLLLVMGSFQVALADEPGPRPTRTPTHTPLPTDTPTITVTWTPPPTLTSMPSLKYKYYLPRVSRPEGNSPDVLIPTATQPTTPESDGPQPIFWAYLFILFAAAAAVVVLVMIYLMRQKNQNRP